MNIYCFSMKNYSVGNDLLAVLPSSAKPWYRTRHLIGLNLRLLCVILCASANGTDGSLLNGLQSLDQWQEFMGHPTGSWLGFINAAQAIGQFVGYPVVAWFINRYGRKKSMYIAYLWLFLGVGIQTGAENHASFIIGRLCIGQVSAWFAGSAPILVTETAYPTHRAVATAIYNCGWYVGSLVAAVAVYGSRNYPNSWAWRIPSILQLTIPTIQFLGILMAPESPRWLISKGRFEEARRILIKFHAGGDENSKWTSK